ncbi:MAG TPA: hypothetical protein VGJ81_21470 [Thermoanaerobaculia bacterium]
MRKLWRVAFVLVAVLFTVASYAQLFFETDYNYYSDSSFSFSSWVGEEDDACDGNIYYLGTTSNYRTRDRIRCLDGINVSHSCWELINGTWTPISCP